MARVETLPVYDAFMIYVEYGRTGMGGKPYVVYCAAHGAFM